MPDPDFAFFACFFMLLWVFFVLCVVLGILVGRGLLAGGGSSLDA